MKHFQVMQKAALAALMIMLFIALFYPIVWNRDPHDFSSPALVRPSREHPLGTNTLGQDNLASLLTGFRLTPLIAFSAAFISCCVGVLVAVLGAHVGGWLDRLFVFLTDLFIIVPDILVIMVFATFAQSRTRDIVLVMAFFSWSRVARVLRHRAIVLMHGDPVQYTLLLKGGLFDVLRKLWRPLYPAVATLFVQQASRAALYEATLAFLGIGDPTIKSWGRTIRSALDYHGIFGDGIYRWWLLPPMLCLVVFALALALFAFSDKADLVRRGGA